MFATLKLPELADRYPQLAALFHQPTPDQIVYNWPVVAVCSLAALVPLAWLQRLPYQATKEERLSEARARQAHHPLLSGASGSATELAGVPTGFRATRVDISSSSLCLSCRSAAD